MKARPVHGLSSLQSQYFLHLERVDFLTKVTIKNRSYSLCRLAAFLKDREITEPEEVTMADLYDYLGSLEGRSAGTINHEKQAIKSFFRWCQVLIGVKLAFNPEDIHRHRVPQTHIQVLSETQVGHVIRKCRTKHCHRQDGFAIALMFEAGLRLGEVANLRIEDIRGSEIRIQGKGGKVRLAFITDRLAQAIADSLRYHKKSQGPLFVSSAEKAYTCDGLRKRIKNRFKASGIIMHPHDLRHAFAVNWLQKGGDLRTLQRLLGHSSLDTTMRYLNITDRHTHEQYRGLFSSSVLEKSS